MPGFPGGWWSGLGKPSLPQSMGMRKFPYLISRVYITSSFMHDLSGWLIDRNVYC
jgi:hypothetical protein